MSVINRIDELAKNSATVVGIDFVYVDDGQFQAEKNQRHLYVFFYGTKPDIILGTVSSSQITIYSPSGEDKLANVPLEPGFPPSWETHLGRRVLHLKTSEAGDFSRYKLRLSNSDPANPKVDPYFAEADFSFKANCPSDLDCATPSQECPPDQLTDYPVNYMARDFWSIRQALLDFASARHPDWQDRLEADFGIMMAEVMSAVGDELAYYQDRISREAYFETATQRRSVRRLARLVDYEMNDGLGGNTWLSFQVTVDTPIPAGLQVRTSSAPAGAPVPSVYEAGLGLSQGRGADGLFAQLGAVAAFGLRSALNSMSAYQWDVSQTCLPAGSTSLDVLDDGGNIAAALANLVDFTNPYPATPGKWAVLTTTPADASVPQRMQLVRITGVQKIIDPLTNKSVARLTWETAQATANEMEFASLVVLGNIVPATAGQTLETYFQIDSEASVTSPPSPPVPHPHSANPYYTGNFSGYAIERQAPGSASVVADSKAAPFDPSFLFSLPGSETRNIVCLGPDTSEASPEVRLFDINEENEWNWKDAFLGENSSLPSDRAFALEDGTWRRAAGYRRVDETGAPQQFIHYDYASGSGATIRFGNGEFGQAPARDHVFRAVYRLGNGRNDNVSANSLTVFNSGAPANVTSVTNPFDVLNALEPETLDHARHSAPYAFQNERLNAVIAKDYANAAQKLDWVERANSVFRWTGSWLTVFTTTDPKNSYTITSGERTDLQQQLDRYRLAGREAYGIDPIYANLVLEICVCVEATAYRGDIEGAVLEALFGTVNDGSSASAYAKPGFFSPNNWTFGMPLERAELEAAIQAVHGVRAVEGICIQRLGWTSMAPFYQTEFDVGEHEIIRIANDPNYPERGAVILRMEGGL